MKKPQYDVNQRQLRRCVKKAQRGDKRAKEQLVGMTYSYVYYYCLKMLRSEDKARDAAQDIFVTVFEKLSAVKKPEAFFGWLKTVTANHCRNLVTRRRETEELREDWEDNNPQVIPEECLETEETCAIIRAAVDALPEIQREVILLYYYQQRSVKEIADLLEIKEGTVKSRLYTARQALKRVIAHYGKDELSFSMLSYALFSEAKTKSGAATAVTLGTGEVLAVSSAAKVGAIAGAGIGVKVAAFSCAGVLAATGTGTYLYAQHVSAQKDEASMTAQEKIAEPTEAELWALFYLTFTDADRRRTLTFHADEPLNSAANKDYLLDRACNTADFFHTLQATNYQFDKANLANPDAKDSALYITYSCDADRRRAKELTCSADGQPVSYQLFQNHKFYDADCGTETWTTYADYDSTVAEKVKNARSKRRLQELYRDHYVRVNLLDGGDYIAFVDVSKRRRYMPELEPDPNPYTYYLRPNFFGTPNVQYQPEPLLMRMGMYDTDSWEITGETEQFGRSCLTVRGAAKEPYDIVSYRLTIDKETGVLIAYECFDENGTLTRQLVTYELIVDEPLDDGIFDDTAGVRQLPGGGLNDQ